MRRSVLVLITSRERSNATTLVWQRSANGCPISRGSCARRAGPISPTRCRRSRSASPASARWRAARASTRRAPMKRWFRRGKQVPVGDYVVDTIDGEIVFVEVLRLGSPSVSLSAMKVVLPDSTELELPDGATGLDAARAIGPKLAEQAVARPRERRGARPARAARRRRVDPDPDHARQERPRRPLRPAPLDRAPARRGGAAALPGREDRDRPADRERLLLRLRVPRADPRVRPRADRGRDAAASWGKGGRGRARRSRARRRGSGSRRRASRTRSSSSTPPRATSRCTRRATSPTSAAARTSRTRSRSRRSS